MSLQVWLPLTGDLHNQGLTNVSVTNNGTTVNANGKLGECYEFGVNKYIDIPDYAATFLTYKTFSLSVWFKCTAQNTGHTGSALISGGNWNAAANLLNLALGNFSSDHYTKILISGSGNWGNGYNYNFYLNTWYHIVLTSGNGAMRVYVNGELIGDSYDAFTPTTLEQSWICIGNGTYNHSFHFIGLMNDVRIYDHCLSVKEIKELSKGLVLHYKLDNLAEEYNNIVFDSSGYENNGTLMSAPTLSTNSIRYSKSTSFDGTDDGILIQNLQLSNIINSEVTYSFWIKPDGETGARSVYFGSYSGTSWSIEKTTGNILRLYWNGSPDETTTGVTIVDNIWQHICITKNGTSDVKLYINGEQKWVSTKAHNALTFPTTYRIGRDTRSGDNTPYKGLMSDFRIYATALSADDILELYHIAASIDNQGNLFCGEVVE